MTIESLQTVYLYSIKAQMEQILNVINTNRSINVDLMKQTLGFLSDTINLFQNSGSPTSPEPTKPELKVINGGADIFGGNVV